MIGIRDHMKVTFFCSDTRKISKSLTASELLQTQYSLFSCVTIYQINYIVVQTFDHTTLLFFPYAYQVHQKDRTSQRNSRVLFPQFLALTDQVAIAYT